MTLQGPTATSLQAAERRSTRGRWIIGGLGILLGILIALIAALPTIANAHGAERAEAWFAAAFQGRIAIGDLALAWFEEQRVDGLVLSDPEGAPIVQGHMVLPPLIEGVGSWFARLGVVRLELDVELVREATGRTNLERALASRDPDGGWGDLIRGDVEVELDVHLTRLALRDAASDLAFEFGDVDGSVRVDPQDPIAIRISGRERRGATFELGADVFAEPDVAFQPLRTEFSLDAKELVVADLIGDRLGERFDWASAALGDSPLALEVRGLLAAGERDVRSTVRGAGLSLGIETAIHAAPFELPGTPAADDGCWDLEFSGQGSLPAAQIDRALALDGWVEGVLGPALAVDFGGRWRGADADPAGVPFDLALTADPATVAWRGALRAGRLVADGDDGLTASLVWNPVVEERLIRPFVPLASAVARRAGNRATEPVRLTLRNVDAGWPLALDDVRAEIGLGLGPASIDLLPALAERLDLKQLSLDQEVVTLWLEAGRVRYPDLALSVDGMRIPVTGSFDLLARTLAFDGSLPAALVGERLAGSLGPLGSVVGAVGKTLALDFTIAGKPEDPLVRFHPPKLDLESPGGLLKQGLQGILETGLPERD